MAPILSNPNVCRIKRTSTEKPLAVDCCRRSIANKARSRKFNLILFFSDGRCARQLFTEIQCSLINSIGYMRRQNNKSHSIHFQSEFTVGRGPQYFYQDFGRYRNPQKIRKKSNCRSFVRRNTRNARIACAHRTQTLERKVEKSPLRCRVRTLQRSKMQSHTAYIIRRRQTDSKYA